MTSSAVFWRYVQMDSAANVRLRCVSITPFGVPVEPDV